MQPKKTPLLCRERAQIMPSLAPVIKCLIIALLYAVPASILAQGTGSGTGGRQSVFQLGAGARAIGLGSAVVAMPIDATTVYWNPGGLDYLERRNAVMFYTPLLEGTKYHFIGMAYPIVGVGTVGGGWLHYDVGDIENRATDSSLEGYFTFGEDLFLLSYARQLPFNLSVGGSVKFQRQQTLSKSARGFGGDIGFLYRPDFGEGILQNLAFGLTFQNVVSPRLTLDNEPESIPHMIRGGIAKSLRFGPRQDLVNMFLAFEKGDRLSPLLNFGSEYVYQDLATLRFGFRDMQPIFGGGVVYQMFQIDYAFGRYAPNEGADIPLQHRISVTVHFGKSKSELIEIAKAQELQRIAEETRKKEILNRRSDFEDKMKTGKAYFEQGDYFQSLIRFAAANELTAGAYDIFREEEAREAQIWVERAQSKISEEERKREEELKQTQIAEAANQQRQNCVETQLQKGLKYVQASQYREAIAEWNRGLECEPANQRLQSLIAQAEKELRNRKNEQLRLAKSYELQGKIVDAIQIYNTLISQNSITPEEQKELQDKVAQLQRQLTGQESFQTGYAEYLKKNYCGAKDLFGQALQVDRSNAKIREYLDDADARCNARLKEFNSESDRQRFVEAVGFIQNENYDAALRILEEIQKGDRYNKRILDAIDEARKRKELKNRTPR
jgi:tetratricopeptide (TPR) repeat protein